MGISSVAIYSDNDKDSTFVQYADYSYPLEGDTAKETYMNIDKIIKIAVEAGVDAIHPGYGFLSENASFVKAVEDSGIVFIGPSSEVVSSLGNKFKARDIIKKLDIPLIPGTKKVIYTFEEAEQIASTVGYPVMIKPAAGGGGKGMNIANDRSELESAFYKSQNLAESVFHDNSVCLERYYADAHHVEVQILADTHGNVLHLGERECSIQRRFQKVVEESPCLIISEHIRNKIFEYAVSIAKEVNYTGAGTIEFLYSNGEVFFLEMNTRIQVEHAVTEMVTDIDIVKMQVLIASGYELPVKQEDIKIRGHAIECRIYSEDTSNNFMPSVGEITYCQLPHGLGVRVDSAIGHNYCVSHLFDPMLAKLIVRGNTREEAICRMSRALDEFIIEGVKTNIDYLKAIMEDTQYINLKVNTNFLKDRHEELMNSAMKTKHIKNRFKQKIPVYRESIQNYNEVGISETPACEFEPISVESNENSLQQLVDEISLPSLLSIDG